MTRRGSAADERYERDAVDWYVGNQLREDIDEATVLRWDEWWEKPENHAEYVEMVQLGEQAGALPRPSPSSDEELYKDLEAMSLPAGESSLGALAAQLRMRPRPFLQRNRSAVIAVALSAVVCVIGLMVSFRFWPTDPGQIYATAPTEQRDFTLEDGSSITLGGDTSINVRFTAAGRMIVLSRGEGMFRVHHDTDRPFSVCAANGCTTAVGTVFDVRIYSNHVRVWVQQGAVDVTPREAMPPLPEAVTAGVRGLTSVRLAHGQEVSYDAQNGAVSAKGVDPLNAGAWTRGSLVYFGGPLREVIEDVQRYSTRRILLDPVAALNVYSGSVVQQHIDQWIRGLPQVFPVEIIDCRTPQESIGSETAQVVSSCASDPERIVIRSR